MVFAYAAAAAAAAAVQNPTWFLGGAYHPPLTNQGGLLQAIEGAKANGGAPIDAEALTVALDVVQAWAVLLTLGFTLVIFVFLAFCVCSKKDDGYDEFEITEGITTVKICHDGGENGVSLIPRVNGSGTLVSLRATDETSEASSRYTLKRELPAIPKQDGKSERPVSQHSMDHYASVSDPLQGGSNLKLIGGVQVLPAGAIAPGGRAAVVKECIVGPKETKVEPQKDKAQSSEPKKGHQYSQVTKPEHAYAKVIERPEEKKAKAIIIQDRRSKELDGRYKSSQSEKRLEESKNVEKVPPKTSAVDMLKASTAKPPSSFSASKPISSLRSPTSPQEPPATSPSRPEPIIPAALAISGRQRANEEMPYMTPPILQPASDQQQHFSGDSQDSRGYTSISVREPLAALKARQAAERTAIKGLKNTSTEGEGYYMTVSDDSADETYACIYEGGSRGTGSETYAQIEPRTSPASDQPLVQSPSALPPSPTQIARSQEQSPPAPPSVDSLRHVVHSRQGSERIPSASSATSTGVGSPVADKRGARSSPLPPLPQGDASLYSPVDPLLSSTQTVPKSPPKSTTQFLEKNDPRSLEEMYAKVNKKSTGHSRGSSAGVETEVSCDLKGIRWTSPTSPNQEMSHSLVETRGHDSSLSSRAKSCEVSWGGMNKEVLQANRTSGNYESIPSQSLYSGSSDPGYETVKNGDPPYASVGNSESCYETVRGSDVESEPGYETLKHKEPGYETVSEVTSKQSAHRISSDFEPGYETVASGGTSDPGYESVQDKDKDYDPGYEELSHPRTLSETDPNYEQLKFTSSTTEHSYEEVKKQVLEGNYELVSNYETQAVAMPPEVFEDKTPVMPLYASVQKKKPDEPKPEQIGDSEKLIDFPIQSQEAIEKVKIEEALDDFLKGVTPETVPKPEEVNINVVPEAPREFSLTQEMITLQESPILPPPANSYLVMDSPEDVELPPPGEEHDESKEVRPETASPKKDSPLISPVEAPPPPMPELETKKEEEETSSEGNAASPVIEQPPVVAVTFTAASPAAGSPQTSDSSTSSTEEVKPKEESPLPPPPVPSLEDVTASPPPPPPPPLPMDEGGPLDFSPPPPPLNGVSEEEASPIPPPASCADENITVTVNPMDDLASNGSEVTVAPIVVDLCSQPSEESTANGSVESVVTVDAKTGTTPAVLQHSQSTSSSESKHSDDAVASV